LVSTAMLAGEPLRAYSGFTDYLGG
jgi:hypothetical protein